MRFFLIDKITKWEIGVEAEAIKNVALSEDFFDDHFPRRPVMPGVLMIEGMAQLSGLLLEGSLKNKYSHVHDALQYILVKISNSGQTVYKISEEDIERWNFEATMPSMR